eukprot:2628166-Ditylum_brightwellii.AAC.1
MFFNIDDNIDNNNNNNARFCPHNAYSSLCCIDNTINNQLINLCCIGNRIEHLSTCCRQKVPVVLRV